MRIYTYIYIYIYILPYPVDSSISSLEEISAPIDTTYIESCNLPPFLVIN